MQSKFVFCVLVATLCIGISGCADKQTNTNSTSNQSASTTVTNSNISMPSGTQDPDFTVDIYDPTKAYNGTTILTDNHNPDKPKIIEVNMKGEIVWEYVIAEDLKQFTNPGLNSERIALDNVLIAQSGYGVYQVSSDGKVIWEHLDPKISHDADRLENGNTLYVYGADDKKSDAQVKEVDKDGNLVWSWSAKDHFDKPPYNDIYDGGWTHTNAVTRLGNGNTLISPRNFGFLVEVDSRGNVVDTFGEDFLEYQHDPEVLENGNLLIANHADPHSVIEVDRQTEEILWEYEIPDRKEWPVRDANRLPNGNTLITATPKIIEVTPEKEVVWQFSMTNPPFEKPKDAPALGFYKAQRIKLDNKLTFDQCEAQGGTAVRSNFYEGICSEDQQKIGEILDAATWFICCK